MDGLLYKLIFILEEFVVHLAPSLYQDLSKLIYFSLIKNCIPVIIYNMTTSACFRTSFNLNDASFLIFFVVECNAFRFSVTVWLVVLFSKPGSKSPDTRNNI